MNKRFFFKKLILFLIPVFIPILILGGSTIIISLHYISEDKIRSNFSLLKQTMENVELILNELDPLSLSFGTDSDISLKLDSILNDKYLDYNKLDNLNIIKAFLSAPVNTRPYIYSIYVYYKNPMKRFITTNDTVVDQDTYYDVAWYQSFMEKDKSVDIWTEYREVKQYKTMDKGTPIISIYKRLYSNTGVIVLNLNPKYIEKILSNLKTFNDQSIFILSESDEVIFKDINSIDVNQMNFKNMEQDDDKLITYKTMNTSYIISQVYSKKYKWRYISVIPQNTFYKAPIQIIGITSFVLVFALAAGTSFTYYLTRKNYNHLMNIISILDSAKNGNLSQSPVLDTSDEYNYIAQNILKSFIEQNYLKMQLSERKYKFQAMELLALQAQINPHFLFNTLETINWKVIALTGKPNEVNNMVGNLSDIMKYSLDGPNHNVLLIEEIKNTISYINIQKIRYREKFDVIWQYDSIVEKYEVVKLILQPLIENSIYHGIKEKSGKSLIKIKIMVKNERLRIAIVDNGLGLEREVLRSIKERLCGSDEYHKHIGLFNTNKRIKLAYGQEYGIHIRSRLNCGTAVYIDIPAILGKV